MKFSNKDLSEIFVYRPNKKLLSLNSDWSFATSEYVVNNIENFTYSEDPIPLIVDGQGIVIVFFMPNKSCIIPLEANQNFIKAYFFDENKIYWMWKEHKLYKDFGLFFKKLK